MSKISDIYGKIQSVIETSLTTYTKIPNPYSVDDNASLLMNKGYGIGIGDGINTERQLGCFLSVERRFNIVLINRVTATENNLTSIANLEKNIMEDGYTLLKALDNDTDLQGTAVKAVYASDSGVAFVDSDIEKYLLLEIEFSIEYLESL